MRYFSVILTKVIQYEVLLTADDEIQAEAKAICGGLERVEKKESVYSVRETGASQANFMATVNEIDYRVFNAKMRDPSGLCCSCGKPFDSDGGCFYCKC